MALLGVLKVPQLFSLLLENIFFKFLLSFRTKLIKKSYVCGYLFHILFVIKKSYVIIILLILLL